MNAEQSVLVRGAMLYDEISDRMDGRTLEILERRRRGPTVRRRGWLVRRMLLGADLIGLVVAFVIAQLVIGPRELSPDAIAPELEWFIFFGTLPLWVFMAKIYGLYEHDEERTDHSTVDEIVGIFHLVTVGAWLMMAVTWVTPWAKPDLTKLVLFWLLAILAISLGRASARSFARRRLAYLQNAVIVGAGDVGQLIGRKLLQHPEYGINLVGFVDAAPKERRDDLAHLTLLGPPEDLVDDRAGLRRRADPDRLLQRLARGAARADPVAQGSRRPDRPRPAPLRPRDAERRHPHRGGPAAPRVFGRSGSLTRPRS